MAPQIQEHVVAVFQVIPQVRVSGRVAEQIVAAPQIQGHAVEVSNVTIAQSCDAMCQMSSWSWDPSVFFLFMKKVKRRQRALGGQSLKYGKGALLPIALVLSSGATAPYSLCALTIRPADATRAALRPRPCVSRTGSSRTGAAQH